MKKPPPTLGLRHVALYSKNLTKTKNFYTELLGMKVIWQPDEDNVYLSTGHDDLALHRADPEHDDAQYQRLDHIGFFIETPEQVDVWYDYLKDNQVEIVAEPKDHRDGARSVYIKDPDGNVVQMLYHPNVT